ncbi:hypothetical protein E4U09_004752 [Claviceps aff. purpurea]|uniref:Uncharacterized protein n=1 Tax=Claviceps aff. purpurea TaxID=1967640 RepID=A0A9P7QRV2_9HYPO|nr:hypothetical protein E4U09_004752 [Claviceps aff. purpurea]
MKVIVASVIRGHLLLYLAFDIATTHNPSLAAYPDRMQQCIELKEHRPDKRHKAHMKVSPDLTRVTRQKSDGRVHDRTPLPADDILSQLMNHISTMPAA